MSAVSPEKFFEKAKIEAFKQVAPRFFALTEIKGNWNDLPASEMQALIEQINDGNDWQNVIYDFTTARGNKWLEKMTLSPSRSLFLDLIDFQNVRTALDIGSGWGQLTRALAKRADLVFSTEPNQERISINYAIAKQEKIENICFLQCDEELPLAEGSIDLILLCGVYEWLAEDQTGDPREIQEAALRTFQKLLSPQGKIVIAIENRTGLKYLLGERDDHSQVPHTSYLPYKEADALYESEQLRELRAHTYDMNEYKEALKSNGFKNISFTLAFPDYKLPELLVPIDNPAVLQHIISSSSLPDEHDGCDGSASANNEILGKIYRATNNLDINKALAPSFIIQAQRE